MGSVMCRWGLSFCWPSTAERWCGFSLSLTLFYLHLSRPLPPVAHSLVLPNITPPYRICTLLLLKYFVLLWLISFAIPASSCIGCFRCRTMPLTAPVTYSPVGGGPRTWIDSNIDGFMWLICNWCFSKHYVVYTAMCSRFSSFCHSNL